MATLRDEDVMSEQEVADLLRVKTETLRAWRTRKKCAGKSPRYIQQGKGRVLYMRADVAAWLLANRKTSSHTSEE